MKEIYLIKCKTLDRTEEFVNKFLKLGFELSNKYKNFDTYGIIYIDFMNKAIVADNNFKLFGKYLMYEEKTIEQLEDIINYIRVTTIISSAKVKYINKLLTYLNENCPNATLCIGCGDGVNCELGRVTSKQYEKLCNLQRINVVDNKIIYFTDDNYYHVDLIAGPIIKMIELMLKKRNFDINTFREYMTRKIK